MKRIGVVLARLMPIHYGHLKLIEFALKQNEEVLVLVGSADKINERNPIPIDFRIQLVNESLKEFFDKDSSKIKVVPLNDLSSEKENNIEWGFYLYANIMKEAGYCTPTIYYSDGAEIITKWFPGFVLRNFVSLSLMARGTIQNGISATEVRKMIENENDKLKEFVPECVYEKRNLIKNFIEVNKGRE